MAKPGGQCSTGGWGGAPKRWCVGSRAVGQGTAEAKGWRLAAQRCGLGSQGPRRVQGQRVGECRCSAGVTTQG